MIVNTSLTDTTWQTHLNGMLALTQHNRNTRDNLTVEMTNLSSARQIALLEETTDILGFFSSRPGIDNIEKAWLILDITKVRLRTLIITMDRFRAIDDAWHATTFKKLDVEKLRVSVKRIQRDLRLIPDLLQREYHPVKVTKATGCDISSGLPPTYTGYHEESYTDSFLCMKWNEYRTLILITGDFLLRTGRFLYAGTSRPNARETTTLNRMMKLAADRICASVAYYINYSQKSSTTREEPDPDGAGMHTTMKTLNALNLMWPLHCAIATESGTTEAQREWMKGALMYIGWNMRIPKAVALADTSIEAFTYSAALAGLALLGSGILRSV